MRRRLLIGAIIAMAVATASWLWRPAPTNPVAKAGLVLDAEEYDFGEAWMSDRHRFVLPVRNTSTDVIRISKIVAGAGDQAIRLEGWSAVIPANDALALSLTLDLTRFESDPAKVRSASRKVWIDAKIVLEGSKQAIPFKLRGRVRLPFLLEPAKLDLGEVVLGRGPIERHTVTVTPFRPMKELVVGNQAATVPGNSGSPTAFAGPFMQNPFSVAEVSVHRVRGQSKRWQVVVRPGGDLRDGPIRFTVYLLAPDSGSPAMPLEVVGHASGSPAMPLEVVGNARSEFRALPAVVAFGVQQVGSTTREILKLVSTAGVPMRLKSVDLTGAGLSIGPWASSENLSLTHELELMFQPAERGDLLGTIVVTAEAGDGTTAKCTTAVQGYAVGKVKNIRIRRGGASPVAEFVRIQSVSPRSQLLQARNPEDGADPAAKALADTKRVDRILAAWSVLRMRSRKVDCKILGLRLYPSHAAPAQGNEDELLDSYVELDYEWLIDFQKSRYAVEYRSQGVPGHLASMRWQPYVFRQVFDGATQLKREAAIGGKRKTIPGNRPAFDSLDWGLFLSIGALPPFDGSWLPPILPSAEAMDKWSILNDYWTLPEGDSAESYRFTLQGDCMVGGRNCAVIRKERSTRAGQIQYDDFFVDEDADCIIRRWHRYQEDRIQVAMDIDCAKYAGGWSPLGWTHRLYQAGKLSQADRLKVVLWNPKARFKHLTFTREIAPATATSGKAYASTTGGNRPHPVERPDKELARRRGARPAPERSLVGVGVVAAGLAVFYWWTRRRKRALK